MNNGLIALTVILSLFGCCLIMGIIYLIYHERAGKAVFHVPLMTNETPDGMYVNQPFCSTYISIVL